MALSTYALVTTDEARAVLGDSTIELDAIEPLINRASALAERIANVHFAQRTSATVYYDGNGKRELVLFQYPIISIDGVWDDTSREFGDTTELTADDDYYAYKETGLLRRYGANWTRGIQNVKIMLTYGYATVPYDVKGAVLQAVQALYEFRGQTRPIKREEFLNYKVEYVQTADGPVPREAYDVFESYSDKVGDTDRFTEGL